MPVDRLYELTLQARQLALATIDGRLRLGDLADQMRRAGTRHPDVLGGLARDLEVDRDLVVDAWVVATQFPPATRRPGIPWSIYRVIQWHPDRHELIDLVARNGWGMDELARELHARFSARYDESAAG